MGRILLMLVLVGTMAGLVMGLDSASRAQAPACSVTPAPDQSLPAAVEEADRGDVVGLETGTWHASVEITRSLTLRGVGDPQASSAAATRARP